MSSGDGRTGPDARPTVFISIPLGINVRDILRLGVLEALLGARHDLEVVLLTPAHRVPEFLREFSQGRVTIAPFRRFEPSAGVTRVVGLRRRSRVRPLVNLLLAAESRLARPDQTLKSLLQESPPHLVVTVHPQDWWDWELISYARRLGIPTLGVVKSWDNIQRGLMVHPDFLAVWNEVNRQEAVALESYQASHIRLVGAPPFDRYFDATVFQSRADYARRLGLEADKKILVYATAGQIMDYGDETYMFEELLRIRARSEPLRDVQIVCRLHANSRLEYFWGYRGTPGVAFSFGSYIKTLGWSMTRAEVDDMANLLYHADVVVSPGSTVTLEAALFDRPTIVPAFHEAQPEHIKRWLIGWHFAKHYRPLVDNDWVPIAWSSAELEAMVCRSLEDPGWYRGGRRAIVEHYTPLRDGRTSERVARLIVELVEHGELVRRRRRGRRALVIATDTRGEAH